MSTKKLDWTRLLIPIAIVFAIVCVLLAKTFTWSEEPVIVELKWLHQTQFAGYYVAEKEGYYNKAGLRVDIHQKNPEINNIESVVEGESQFAVISANELLKAIDEKQPIIAIAALYQKSPSVIVSLKEKNIKTPEDFKDKKLGIVSDTLENRLIYTSLAKTIPSNNFSFISTGFSQIKFLESGQADAVSLYRISELQKLKLNIDKYNIIYPENYGRKLYDDILITNTNFLKDNPKTVEKFVKATLKGWQEAINNPEKATQISLNYMPKKNQNHDYQKNMLVESIELMKTNDKLKIGSMSEQSWQEQITYLKNAGLISQLNPKDVFTNEFVK